MSQLLLGGGEEDVNMLLPDFFLLWECVFHFFSLSVLLH